MIIFNRENNENAAYAYDKKYAGSMNCIAIYSQKPMRRMIDIVRNNKAHDRRKTKINGKYFLSFPDMLFKIYYVKIVKNKKVIGYRVSGLNVVFSSPYEEGAYPRLFVAPLPNLNGSRVCIGLSFKEFKTLKAAVDDVIGIFWKTKFNNDIIVDWNTYSIKSLMYDYNKWQDKTKKKLNWIPTEKNLKPTSYNWRTFSTS